MDPIAIWTLVFTVIGAGAAVAAAYFGWKAPSKEDLQRVERNTAESAEHIEAVRGHLAGQNKRALLADQAARVHIIVQGSGWSGQPMALNFTLEDPSIKLLRIDMINRQGLSLGTLDCQKSIPLTFSVKIDSNPFSRWIGGSDNQGSADRWLLRVRACLEIEGAECSKEFSILALQNLQQTSPSDRNFSHFIAFTGEC